MRLDRRFLARTGVFLALSLVPGGPGPALASLEEWVPAASLALEDVVPGRATAKTVLKGTEIVEIPVEIVSVVRDVGPDQDMILARALGDEIGRLGVPQGISGSPVYVDGKLIGAISSSWSFAKEPLMGITPVHQMARDAAVSAATVGERSNAAPDLRGDLLRDPAPPGARSSGPVPIAAPLVLSGFDRRLVDLATDLFGPWGFTVAEGGTAGRDQRGGAIEPGATIGVRLAGGDANITSIGSVTWVDGDRVHAWGHPLFQMGDVEMPLVSGYIHAIVPTQLMSFKLGVGADVVGTLVSDRRSGIFGRLGSAPPLTRFDLKVVRGGETERFEFEIVRDRFLSPTLVGLTAANALLARGSAVGDETVRFTQRLVLDDGRETTVATRFAGDQTLRDIVTLLSDAARVIVANPFEDVRLARIEGEIAYETGIRLGFLTDLRLEDDRPEPGDEIRGSWTVRDWRGRESRRSFEIPLPADAREGRYLLLVADAATAETYEAERDPRSFGPRTLDELLERIRRLRQTDEVHVHLYRQSQGLQIEGRPLADLPPSVLSVMRGAARSGIEENLPAELVAELRFPAGGVVQGGHTILFEVRKERP